MLCFENKLFKYTVHESKNKRLNEVQVKEISVIAVVQSGCIIWLLKVFTVIIKKLIIYIIYYTFCIELEK